ncbi:MAG: dockerin type I domain-containing protein [bacterium]
MTYGGDVDRNGAIDVGDLTYLVAYLFQGGPAPPCPEEGDVDGSGGIDVGDLTYLVAYLFLGGPAPPPC